MTSEQELIERQRKTILRLCEKLAELQHDHSDLCDLVSVISEQNRTLQGRPAAGPPPSGP